jgi:hypothetical protein
MLSRKFFLCLLLCSSPQWLFAQTTDEKIDDLLRRVSELEKIVGDPMRSGTIRGELTKLTDDTVQELGRIRRTLAGISTTDGTTKAPIPLVSRIMRDSADFRQDFKNAVDSTLQRTGTLVVHNKTASPQQIFVNRTEYRLGPYESDKRIPVDAGTVAVQLPGRELTTWSIAPPYYIQSVDIVSATRQTYVPIVSPDNLHLPISSTIVHPLYDFQTYAR